MIYNYKNFLYEQHKLNSEYVKEITAKDFFDFLTPTDGNSKYTLYPNANRIFRQVNTEWNNYGDFNIINPKMIQRRSPNASSNYTNLLTSNLPSWKKYPKRNRSLICGNYNRTKGHFDLGEENLFLVIPQNNAKIGMCAEDFWDSFNNIDSLNELGDIITELIGYNFDDSWIKTKNRLNKISIDDWNSHFKYSDFTFDQNKSIIENFDDLLNPKLNKFKLTKWNNNFQFDYDLTISDQPYQEVWTDSTSLLIRYSVADELGLI